MDMLGFVGAAVSATRDEQPHFPITTQRHRRDCKAQTFTFPTGANEQQRDVVRLQIQIAAGFFPQLRIEPEFFERNTVSHDVDPVRGIAIKIDNLILHHA